VIYLLGTADTNPDHPALDKSCMAEAQGPYRYVRGHTVAATMAMRVGGAVRPAGRWRRALERDGMRLNRHRALGSCLSMVFSENRFRLFRIMLFSRCSIDFS
jgi:hypothetical protein